MSLTKELQRRGFRFWHAENLNGFRSYLAAKNLLSRKKLLVADGGTPFYSDQQDAQLGVQDRVFGNLSDFGHFFATFPRTTPNAYGPIALCFVPQVFDCMADVAVTSETIGKSAGRPGGWRHGAIADAAGLVRGLAGPADADTNCLHEAWSFAELSTATPRIPLHYLEKVVVEPITVGGRYLPDVVAEDLSTWGVSANVEARQYSCTGNLTLLQELVDALYVAAENGTIYADFRGAPPSWRTALVNQADKQRRLGFWIRYFGDGTLKQVRSDLHFEWLDANDDRTICEACDPGEDRSPPLVNYTSREDLAPFDVGYCDWCNTVHMRCGECGEVLAVDEGDYDEPQECSCGNRFVVRAASFRDGDAEVIELLGPEAEDP